MLVCGPFNSIRLEFVYFFETRIANLRLSFCFWLNLGFYLNCEEKFFDEKKLDNPKWVKNNKNMMKYVETFAQSLIYRVHYSAFVCVCDLHFD